MEDTNIDAIEDEMLRRIYTLERFRDFPMCVEDQSQLLDILKVMAGRIIKLERDSRVAK